MYLVTGSLQGTLLVMGSYFEFVHWKREREELEGRIAQGNGSTAPGESVSAEHDERTPLLRPD